MSTTTHKPPESAIQHDPDRDSGIVHQQDDDPACRACPVCGSSNTYQTMEGRWGCLQCGSTWAWQRGRLE
jgi:ribosomal protein S27AE